MLTEEHRKYHRMYEEHIPQEVRELIDQTMEEFMTSLTSMEYQADGCDSAERLISDMTRYFIYGNPSFRNASLQKESV